MAEEYLGKPELIRSSIIHTLSKSKRPETSPTKYTYLRYRNLYLDKIFKIRWSVNRETTFHRTENFGSDLSKERRGVLSFLYQD